MNKPKNKQIIIINPIFKTETLFMIGDRDWANKILEKNETKDRIDDDCLGTVLRNDRGQYVYVYIQPKGNEIDFVTGLTHEITHLVTRILESRNVFTIGEINCEKVTGNGDETFAYTVEFYLREVLKKLKDNK